MKLIETPFKDLLLIEPRSFNDPRGYFFESYNSNKFSEIGIDVNFVQDNESFSTYGVIRGLHYQLAPYAQSMLVRVVKGKILDVAVDIRLNSPTFGKHFSVELNDSNKYILFIPKGFAHGFSVLSESAIVVYKCDSVYNQQAERGIYYNDSTLGIDWKLGENEIIVSSKDNVLPLFNSIESNFVYGGKY